MSRIVVLDSGPLGLACSRIGTPKADDCRAWLVALELAGVDVLIPTVADYEVRRELVRIGATAKLGNLDGLLARFPLADVTAEAFRRAAEFWAIVRRGGLPTAGRDELDADALIAGVAATVGAPGDVVAIATTNVRHLARFPGIDAREWNTIA